MSSSKNSCDCINASLSGSPSNRKVGFEKHSPQPWSCLSDWLWVCLTGLCWDAARELGTGAFGVRCFNALLLLALRRQ